MKKILSFFPIALLCVFVSCSDNKTESTTGSDTMSSGKKDNAKAEKNLAILHAVNKAFETGEVGGLDSIISSGFIDHTDRGDKTGVDSLKAAIAWARDDSKDMKIEVIKELADEDYVVSWQRYSGTSKGGMNMGKPGSYDMKGLEVVKFKDGKAVEHWAFVEMQDVMKMMPQMSAGKTDDKK